MAIQTIPDRELAGCLFSSQVPHSSYQGKFNLAQILIKTKPSCIILNWSISATQRWSDTLVTCAKTGFHGIRQFGGQQVMKRRPEI